MDRTQEQGSTGCRSAALRALGKTLGRLLLTLSALVAAAAPGSTAAAAPAAMVGEILGPDPSRSIHQLVHDVWQVEDGLPSNDIIAIVESADGFLWLATRGGVVRFDGLRFEVFNQENTPVFETDDFGALAEGRDGSLWIGSRGAGLYRYRDGHFEAFPAPTPAGNDLRALRIDQAGVLWIGTLGGLFRFEDEGLVEFSGLADLGLDVRELHEDASGRLWVGTRGQGLWRLDGDRPRQWTTADGLVSDRVITVVTDSERAVWVGTESGLNRLSPDPSGDRIEAFGTDQGLIGQDIVSLTTDAVGAVWISTTVGLSRYYEGEFEHFGFRTELSPDIVRIAYLDRAGSLWVGTYGSGLNRFKNGQITPYTPWEGLSSHRIFSVIEDRPGSFWIGGADGFDRLESGRVAPFEPPRPFPARNAYSIARDRADGLWVGTADGLLHYPAIGGLRRYTAQDGLPSDSVRIVYQDPTQASTLWIGTFDGGVSRWRDGTFSTYDTDSGLSNNRVRTLLQDRDGSLWIGTEIGLNRLRDERIESFTTADGLSGNSIRSLYQDADGVLWIGTRGAGLMRYQNGAFHAYTTRDGLPFNDLWSILGDDQGHLWWSSDQGIVRVRVNDLEAYDRGQLESIPTQTYGLADGMKAVECNGIGYPAGWKASDGGLWFASVAGAVRVDPVIRPRAAVHGVTVESVRVGERDFTFDPSASTRSVTLPPGSRNLEIAYTAPDLSDAHRLEFRYRLAGYDLEWVEVGPRRTAFYTQLPPGSYSFEVAAGRDRAWSAATTTLLLEVEPHFFETWWFAGLSALIAVLGILGGIELRTRKARERAERLLEEVEQRQRAEAELEHKNAELERKNAELERFNYTVSHDLRSPLVTIKGFLGFLRRDVEDQNLERIEHDLVRIETATNKMERLLRELLELSRVGRLVNTPEEVPLAEVIDEAIELVAGPIAASGAEIEIARDLPVVLGDRVRLVEVFQNLIENATRFFDDQSLPRIAIGVREVSDGTAVCTVQDNGIGIDPCYHQKVFELFERLDPDTEGTGVGLALVKRIVELHGGRVWVESEGDGRGSTFCVTLPVDPTALEPDSWAPNPTPP